MRRAQLRPAKPASRLRVDELARAFHTPEELLFVGSTRRRHPCNPFLHFNVQPQHRAGQQKEVLLKSARPQLIGAARRQAVDMFQNRSTVVEPRQERQGRSRPLWRIQRQRKGRCGVLRNSLHEAALKERATGRHRIHLNLPPVQPPPHSAAKHRLDRQRPAKVFHRVPARDCVQDEVVFSEGSALWEKIRRHLSAAKPPVDPGAGRGIRDHPSQHGIGLRCSRQSAGK